MEVCCARSLGATSSRRRRTWFPGQWHALLEITGVGQCSYELTLRENGQIEGTGCLLGTGILGQMVGSIGSGSLLKTPIPISGEWTDLAGRLWRLSQRNEPAAPGREEPANPLRDELAQGLQRAYGMLKSAPTAKRRAVEQVFLTTAAFAFEKLSLPSSRLRGAMQADNPMQGRVTYEVLTLLEQNRLLRR